MLYTDLQLLLQQCAAEQLSATEHAGHRAMITDES